MSIGDLLKDGRYQIVNKLGKGSQGVVFLVEDLKTKEKYLNC
jgi:serine/threonine protein kinase